jgi:hypothetical protein
MAQGIWLDGARIMAGCHIRQNGRLQQLLPEMPLMHSARYHFGAGISKASQQKYQSHEVPNRFFAKEIYELVALIGKHNRC